MDGHRNGNGKQQGEGVTRWDEMHGAASAYLGPVTETVNGNGGAYELLPVLAVAVAVSVVLVKVLRRRVVMILVTLLLL